MIWVLVNENNLPSYRGQEILGRNCNLEKFWHQETIWRIGNDKKFGRHDITNE